MLSFTFLSGMRRRSLSLIALASLLGACQASQSSQSKDIYTTDVGATANGNTRRHQASVQEANWTVNADGCSGTLIDAEHILLAAHCKAKVGDTYQSGLSVLTKGAKDIRVSSVLEQSTELDYALLGISWIRPASAQQAYPNRIAIEASEVYLNSDPDQGDQLFTVGFPDDKANVWSATYAEGQAKVVAGDRISFNVGIINGNSGGGVLKRDNMMLVAVATSGRSNYSEPGWDKNDPNNPIHWNSGTPTWSIYRQSRLLPQLFPNGVRRDLGQSFAPKTQLFVALDSTNEPRLWVSSNHETDKILLCPATASRCSAGTAGHEVLSFREQRSERKLYQRSQVMTADTSYLLQAFDAKGQLIGSRPVQIQKRGNK